MRQLSIKMIEHITIFIKILDNLREILFGFLVEVRNRNASSKDSVVWML